MKKPSKKLEREIMEQVFCSYAETDQHKALAIWKKNPWLLVSMYEATFYPENLGLPLVMPKGVYTRDDKRLSDRVREFLEPESYFEESERAPEGTVSIDGVPIKINRFGRITNPNELDGYKA